MDQPVTFSEELQQLQKILQFPEEVALHLTDTEHALFQRVRPVDYIRQITVDLSKLAYGVTASQAQCSLYSLVHQFHQVGFKTLYHYIY